MMKVIAWSEQPEVLAQLEKYCGKVAFIELVMTFQQLSEIMAWLITHSADLLFLDSEILSGNNKMMAGDMLEKHLVVPITSDSSSIKPDCKNVVDVLVMPYLFKQFEQVMIKASERFEAAEQQYVYLHSDYHLHRLPIMEMIYIEGADDYLKIFTVCGRKLIIRMTLKEMLTKLPKQEFIRIHRSYIVSVRHISHVGAKLTLSNGVQIRTGERFRNAANLQILDRLKRDLGSKEG